MTVTNRNPIPIVINKLQHPLNSFTLLEFQDISSLDENEESESFIEKFSVQRFWTSVLFYSLFYKIQKTL